MNSSFFLTSPTPPSRLDLTVNDNRKNQRFELRLPLEVVRSGNRPHPSLGYTLNLSSSGVLFESDDPPMVGDIIEYYITLPTSANAEEAVRLRCMGKVMRSHERFAAATMERYEFVRNRPVLSFESHMASEAAAS